MPRLHALKDSLATLKEAGSLATGELLQFEGGALGVVTALRCDHALAWLLDPPGSVVPGGQAQGAGLPVGLPVEASPGGRVIDPLGRPLDGGPALEGSWTPLSLRPRSFQDRRASGAMLWTGSKQIDLLVGLRRGTATAIVGEPGSGRSALAMDAVITQVRAGARCVIATCGGEVARLPTWRAALRRAEVDAEVLWVTARAGSPYLTALLPTAALAVAEAWVRERHDVLLVMDGVDPQSSWTNAAARVGASPAGGTLSLLVVPDGPLPQPAPLDRQIILVGRTHRLDPEATVGYLTFDQVYRPPLRGWGKGLLLALRSAAEIARLVHDVSAGEIGWRLSDLDATTLNVLAAGERLWAALDQPPGVPAPIEEQIVTVYAVLWDFTGLAEGWFGELRRRQPELLQRIRASEGLQHPLGQQLDAALTDLGGRRLKR